MELGGLLLVVSTFILTYCQAAITDWHGIYNSCGCEDPDQGVLPGGTVWDMQNEGNYYFMLCCAQRFLSNGSQPNPFSIQWEYTPEGSNDVQTIGRLKEEPGCHGQKIFSLNVDILDAGSYKCNITFTDDKSTSGTMVLEIHERKDGYRIAPRPLTPSKQVYSNLGDSLELTCSFVIGPNANKAPYIAWYKSFPNGTNISYRPAQNLPGVKVTGPIIQEGDASAYLNVDELQEVHFGNYSCRISTYKGTISQSITLIKDLPPDVKKLLEMKYIFSSVVATLAFVVIFASILCRFRFYLHLKIIMLRRSFKDPKHPAEVAEGGAIDVFIVSGPSADSWVNEILLKKLEEEYGLRCFLPDRDILAGEETLEAIFQGLNQSRRILIIISECLFRSRWCAYAMFQAVHTSLSRPTKVLSILLADKSILNAEEADAQKLLNTLRCIKRLKCPLDYGPFLKRESYEPEENQQDNDSGIHVGNDVDQNVLQSNGIKYASSNASLPSEFKKNFLHPRPQMSFSFNDIQGGFKDPIHGNKDLTHPSKGSYIYDNKDKIYGNIDSKHGNKDPINGYKILIHGDQNPINGSKDPIHRNKDLIHVDKDLIHSNKYPTRGNKDPILGNQNPTHPNMDPTHRNDDPTHDNKDPIHGNKDQTHQNRIQNMILGHNDCRWSLDVSKFSNSQSNDITDVVQECPKLSKDEPTRLYLNLKDNYDGSNKLYCDSYETGVECKAKSAAPFLTHSFPAEANKRSPVRSLLFGDPEVLFWQKLLIHLSPSVAMKNNAKRRRYITI